MGKSRRRRGWAGGAELDHRIRLIGAKHTAQRLADLTDCRVGADRLDRRWHDGRRPPGRPLELAERVTHRAGVAGRAHTAQPLDLLGLDRLIDRERMRSLLSVVDHKAVHTHDATLPAVDLLLYAIRRLRDLLLEPARLDAPQSPAELVDLVELDADPALDLGGQGLDRVRPAQRIDDFHDARLLEDDLLRPQ